MSFFDRLAFWRRPAGDETREGVLPEGYNVFTDPDGLISRGATIGESNAMSLISVFAAVCVVAETLGSLPLITYQRQQPWGKRRASEHPLYRVLNGAPNDLQTSQGWIETMVIHAMIYGTGYSHIHRDTAGNVVELTPLLPDRTQAHVLPSGGLVYQTQVAGESRYLMPYDVFRLPGPSKNGIEGIPRVRTVSKSLATAQAQEQYANESFANGVHPSGSVTHPQGIGPIAAANLRADIERQHTGLGQRHRVMVLQEGATFNPFQTDPGKHQLLDSRRFSVEEIGRLFRVPSILLNHTKDSNYSIGEQMTLHFLKYTLRPWGTRFKSEAGLKLFLEVERDDFYAEFLYEDLLTADWAAKATYYRELFNLGAITSAEIRQRENLNPYAAGVGDKPMLNGAYQPLEEIGRGREGGVDEARMTGYVPAARAAECFGVPKQAARRRLDRFRSRSTTGWLEVATRDDTEPRYLYDLGAIRELFTGEDDDMDAA